LTTLIAAIKADQLYLLGIHRVEVFQPLTGTITISSIQKTLKNDIAVFTIRLEWQSRIPLP